jgi:hypothetical protein
MSNINYKYYKKIYEDLFKNDLGFRLKIIGNLHFRDYGNDNIYSEGYIYVLALYFYGDVIARAGVEEYEISNPYTYFDEPQGALVSLYNVKNHYKYLLKVEAYEFFEHQMSDEEKGFFTKNNRLSSSFYNGEIEPNSIINQDDFKKIDKLIDIFPNSNEIPLNTFKIIKGVAKHNFQFSFTYSQMFELYMITLVYESAIGIDINLLMGLYVSSRLEEDNCHDDFVRSMVYISVASMFEYRKYFKDLYIKNKYI